LIPNVSDLVTPRGSSIVVKLAARLCDDMQRNIRAESMDVANRRRIAASKAFKRRLEWFAP
jgi:hypothetical protein